jgi:hypothetical protein
MAGGALALKTQNRWEQKVADQLPLMGHRNWIVIVDSAYPLQTSSGVETIETGEDQLTVLDRVLGAIKDSRHVRPLVYIDAELEYVPESEAPGVDRYREQMRERLAGLPGEPVLHESLIKRLNQAGESFSVLVLKTTMTIPYTSVFLELDCKYWGAVAEASLRKRMST